jgi:arsenite methyltransferase
MLPALSERDGYISRVGGISVDAACFRRCLGCRCSSLRCPLKGLPAYLPPEALYSGDMMADSGKQRISKERRADKRLVLRPGGFGLTDRALELCAFKAGDRVADVGCGFGATVHYLRTSHGLDALGIDPAVPAIEQGLRYNPSLPLSAGFAEELPFESGTLDGVLAECTLSVIANKEQALSEFCRVLRPGGRLAVTDVYARNADAVEKVRKGLPFGMTDILTRDTLAAMLKRQAFSVSAFEDHSEALKEYLIQAIMDGGAECVWLESARALKPASLGYFLMTAEKEA